MKAKEAIDHNQALTMEALEFVRMSWRVFGDEALLKAARDIFRYPPRREDNLSQMEADAAWVGAALAGEYLAECETTDFADLDEDQQAEFLRRLIVGYRAELRRLVEEEIPDDA